MSFIDHSYNKCISYRFLSWQHRCYNMIFVYPKLYYTMCGTTPFPMSVRHCKVIGGHRMVKIMSVDGREVCETISFSRNHAWYKPATSFCRVILKNGEMFPGRSIPVISDIPWLARSLDLIPWDFFLWSY